MLHGSRGEQAIDERQGRPCGLRMSGYSSPTFCNARSIDRIRPENRCARSLSNQDSTDIRRRPSLSNAIPFGISPRVSTLMCRIDSSAASIHLTTFADGRGLTISEMTLVSSRNPLTGQYLDRYRDLSSGPNPIYIAVNGERTRLSSSAGADVRSIPQIARRRE